MRIAKVDSNQPEIVKALRGAGAIVKHVHTLKNLFDILVFYDSKTYCVEIKNGKGKLTKGEQSCADDLMSVGVAYWIVYSVEDATRMIQGN